MFGVYLVVSCCYKNKNCMDKAIYEDICIQILIDANCMNNQFYGAGICIGNYMARIGRDAITLVWTWDA